MAGHTRFSSVVAASGHGSLRWLGADVVPNLDLARSCSFIFSETPTADPAEVANGDCSNKSAVQDLQGHGTHVSTIIAGADNGIGVVGVAPEATIVALKARTVEGFCFADSVAAALRYAGDQRLDVVNLSPFAASTRSPGTPSASAVAVHSRTLASRARPRGARPGPPARVGLPTNHVQKRGS